MRLRPLTEAECYARCYGGRRDDGVSLVSVLPKEGAGTQAPAPRRYEAGDPSALRRFRDELDHDRLGHGEEAA